jgi:hypothetical protein
VISSLSDPYVSPYDVKPSSKRRRLNPPRTVKPATSQTAEDRPNTRKTEKPTSRRGPETSTPKAASASAPDADGEEADCTIDESMVEGDVIPGLAADDYLWVTDDDVSTDLDEGTKAYIEDWANTTVKKYAEELHDVADSNNKQIDDFVLTFLARLNPIIDILGDSSDSSDDDSDDE